MSYEMLFTKFFISKNADSYSNDSESGFFVKFMWGLSILSAKEKNIITFFLFSLLLCTIKKLFPHSSSSEFFVDNKIIYISKFIAKDFKNWKWNNSKCFSRSFEWEKYKFFCGRKQYCCSSEAVFIVRRMSEFRNRSSLFSRNFICYYHY